MSDLGSKAALNADIDAKVTTNGANENTGARVNDCLNNIVDTLYGSGAAPTATFSTNTNTAQDPGQDTVRFNSGTIASVTEIGLSDVVGGVDKGTLNSQFSGIIQFRPVGTTGTIEFQITGVVHTSWTRYTVTYLRGTLPANGTVMAVRFLPSNTVNAATTAALAGKADVYLDAVKQNYQRTITGMTASGGKLVVDLTALTPAFATAQFVCGGGANDVSLALVGHNKGSPLSAFEVQFWDCEAAANAADDIQVQFTVIGTKA